MSRFQIGIWLIDPAPLVLLLKQSLAPVRRLVTQSV